jgi:hypothetical protein
MKICSICFLILFAGASCISTKSEVEVKPIHITIDVNVKVKVENDLEDVFGDLDNAEAELTEGEVK